jgi:hypothetical protein
MTTRYKANIKVHDKEYIMLRVWYTSEIIMTDLTIVSVVAVVLNFGGDPCAQRGINNILLQLPCCDNKLLLPSMCDELRLELEDGSLPVIWAKAG